MMVMSTMLAMVAAQISSSLVSAINGDPSSSESISPETSSPTSSAGVESTSEKDWLKQQEAPQSSTQIHDSQLLDNASSHRMDILLGSLETSSPILKHLPKFTLNITQSLPTRENTSDIFEGVSNRTSYSVNSKHFIYNNTSNSSDGNASSCVSNRDIMMSNSDICFCNQCIVHLDVVTENASESNFSECCYVKRFLTSGCLNAGKLALNVLQQCITTESKYLYNFQDAVNHNKSRFVLLSENTATKVRELRQANCVLRSLGLVYEWRKNYDAIRNNIIGENDRHFDANRYRKLLSSIDATLESMPEFVEAVSDLDGIGAACLDIIWAPVFATALGKNRSAFELFLREERSKLKKTLWTGLMFRNYLDPIVYFLLILFGMLSNGSLLLMFVRYKEMHTQRNVLLLNLVIVDLMNLATVAPLYLLSKYCSPNLFTGELGCRVFLCYRIIVRYNIEFSLAALTAQRYSAITKHRLSNRTCAVFYIIAVWVMSVIATLPHILAFVIRGFSCFSFRKEPGDIGFLVDHVLMMFLSVFVPAVVFVLSILMARRLIHSIQEMPREARQSFQKQEFARSRSARVVVALAVVFAFTHTPRSLWYGCVPWAKIDRQSAAFLWIDGTLNYLYYLNSCLNPCAMYFSCSAFRSTFRRCFFCISREYNTEEGNQSQRTQEYYIPNNCHF